MSWRVKCELGFGKFLCWVWSLFNATKKEKMFLKICNGISRNFIKGNDVGIPQHCLDIGTSHVPSFLDRQYRLPANKRSVILISIDRYNNRSSSMHGKKLIILQKTTFLATKTDSGWGELDSREIQKAYLATHSQRTPKHFQSERLSPKQFSSLFLLVLPR